MSTKEIGNKAGYFNLFLLASFVWMWYVAPAVAEEQEMGTLTPVFDVYMPGPAGKTLTNPSGWGAFGNTLFVGAGITAPQTYTDKSDGAAGVGFGIGHPARNVGLQVVAILNDLSEQDDISFNVTLHRSIGRGTSMSIGAEHLFQDEDEYGRPSYYIALGHASQNVRSKTAGISRLHTSLGVGSGRFAHKTLRDEAHGRGGSGTSLFGALSYEVFERTNVILEWSGINLNAGVSFVPFNRIPLGIMLGAADLTDNSGDRVRFIGGLGLAYQL